MRKVVKRGIILDELDELFAEIITFEEEIKSKDPVNCTYPDKKKAKRVFQEYIEWRFNQIQPKMTNHTQQIS